MSHLILSLIDCPTLQRDLNDVNECKIYPNENLPVTQFLTSELNTNRVLETSVSPGAGKLRTVQLTFTPRVGEGEVDTTLTTDCETALDAGMDSETYTIDPNAGVEWKESVDFSDIATICKSNPQWIAERMQAGMDGLARKMETIATNQLAALYGKFVTNGDSDITIDDTLKTIATVGADGKFTEDAIQEITYSAMNSGFCGIPFVFGYGDIWKYMQKTKAVCCAASGIDFAQFMAQNQAMFFSTYRVPTSLGLTQGFLALDAGSAYLLQYNRFAEGSGQEGDNSFMRMGTIVNPKNGIEYNFKIYRTICGEKLNMFISTAFKVVALPSTFTGGDRFVGANGILRFNVVNP